jgi:PKD repeat protein
VYINATTAQGPNYHLNNTYTTPGIYQYFIWTNDNSGNSYSSGSKYFKITGTNSPPYVIGNPTPSNGSTRNNLNLTWSVPINDFEGNTFSWTIQCSNGQSNSGAVAANGTKSLSLSGLAYFTTYKVWVNATDPAPNGSGNYNRFWYTFTTKGRGEPVFGTPSPGNGSTVYALSLTWSILINDLEGNTFNWTIHCSNGQSANASGASNGTKSLSLSGLAYSTKYTVWVNATDPISSGGSGRYTRKWFTFTPSVGGGGGGGNVGGGGGTPPIPNFIYSPLTPTTNDSIQFTDQSTDPDGSIVNWTWNFGDGTTSTIKSPFHQYNVKGNFTVTLTVKDNDGYTGTKIKNIAVKMKPMADFSYSPQSPKPSDTIQFTDLSHDPDGSIVSWLWNFGDQTNGTNQNPTHKYTNSGIYSIQLQVTDNDGFTTSKNTSIIVNQPPIPNFSPPLTPKTGDTIQFTDNSNDPDGTIASWYWNFGDGTSSTEKNPTHQYQKSGTYQVSLQVTDNKGASNSKTVLITIKDKSIIPGIPGFELIVVIGAIALVMLWKRKRKESN